MRSKLLPIADLNAILLSIFLVLSLGSSRGLIGRQGELPDEKLQVTLRENKTRRLDSYTLALWSGSAFQFKVHPRASPLWIEKLMAQKIGPSDPNAPKGASCSTRIHFDRSFCHANIEMALRDPDSAAILDGGECHHLSDSELGRSFVEAFNANKPLFDQYEYFPGSSNSGSTSIYFNDFEFSDNREITILRSGHPDEGQEIAIYGAVCRVDPRSPPLRPDLATNSCSAADPRPFSLVQLTKDNTEILKDKNGTDAFEISGPYAASVLSEASEPERTVPYQLAIENSLNHGPPHSVSLELSGRGGATDLPDQVLFVSRDACEAYRKGQDAPAQPWEGHLSFQGEQILLQQPGFVQLFEVRARDQSVTRLSGLRTVE